MGYRTVVILSNDQAHEWKKDPELGQKIALAASSENINFQYGNIVEQVHCDTQSLIAIDSLTGYALASNQWYHGQDHYKMKVDLVEQAAIKFGITMNKPEQSKTEYKITLHTEAGDVATCIPFDKEQMAFDMISDYRKNGKKFTVTTE